MIEVFHLTLLVCANEKFRTNPFLSQPRFAKPKLKSSYVSPRERTRRKVQQCGLLLHDLLLMLLRRSLLQTLLRR